jgi:hypothetical protein
VAYEEDTVKLLVPKNPALAVTDPDVFTDPVTANANPVALLEMSREPVITPDPLKGNPVPDPPPLPTDAVVKILLVAVSSTRTLLVAVVSAKLFS